MEPGSDECVAAVAAALAAVAPAGLDEDVMAYVASMVAEDPARDAGDLADTVGGFLELDEDAALDVCTKLVARLVADGVVASGDGGASGGGDASASSGAGSDGVDHLGPPTLLKAPVTLGAKADDHDEMLSFMWKKEGSSLATTNSVLEDGELDDAKARAKREAKVARKEAAALKRESGAAAGAGAMAAAPDIVVVGERGRNKDIFCPNFTIGFVGRQLLVDASLKLVQGRRYGFVGRNGYGKTTLLRHISARELDGIPRDIRIMHVEQEVSGTSKTVLETVLATDRERTELLAEAAAIEGGSSGGGGASAPAPAADAARTAGAAAAAAGASTAAEATATATPVATTSAASTTATSEASVTAATASTPKPVAAAAPAPPASAADVKAKEAKEARDIERLKAVYARLVEIDADTAETRATVILDGLGFTKTKIEGPTSDLSGGWRMRVSLACALFAQPELLMLDEPTNHLDMPSVMWLENYLQSWPGTCIIVSHDREFLNEVVTDVIHLDKQKLNYYRGDYTSFEESRAERARHQQRAFESNEARKAHMQSFVDRFRFNAKRASLVQSRLKAIARLETLEEVVNDPKWAFSFPDPGELSRPVLAVKDVSFAYPKSEPLFEHLDFGIDTDSRIAILGPNGAGKSTLLKLLLGELDATDGYVSRNGKLRAAFFAQHHVNQLDLKKNAVDHVAALFPDAKKDEVRAHVGRFGLVGDLALQTMSTLSGGQKSRVAFAVMCWKKPHMIVMDEPTNHLDTDTIDALIVAIGAFKGGVIVVSHDQHFVSGIADEIWDVGDKTVKRFEGTLPEYKKKLIAKAAEEEARKGRGGGM